MKLKYLVLPALLFFAGCGTDSIKMPDVNIPFMNNDNGICNTEPKWVVRPPVEKNAIYGVGIAPRNFNGEQAQRKSALAKAINEIASQLNTTVNSQVATSAAVVNGQGNSAMSSVSFQTVNGQKVSAKIVKSCKNPNNGYLYILMKANR
jgi:hypothetical protein